MSRLNVWDEAGILPMAIRLRKAGKCPQQVDNLFGQIIVEIVLMATRLLPDEDPRYGRHVQGMMAPDVQSLMVFNALRAAEKFVDDRKNPRTIVNYIVKSVQNRLRNWVRDTETRKRKMDIVTESETKYDMHEYSLKESNILGEQVWKESVFKTQQEKTQGDDNG